MKALNYFFGLALLRYLKSLSKIKFFRLIHSVLNVLGINANLFGIKRRKELKNRMFNYKGNYGYARLKRRIF